MLIEIDEDLKVIAKDPFTLYAVMRQVLLRNSEIDLEREMVFVVGMAWTYKIRYIDMVNMGSEEMAQVTPMGVYRLALNLGAKKIALIHNHPGRDLLPEHLTPSPGDDQVTAWMYYAGKIIAAVDLVEHLIISPDYFYSYVREGRFELIKKDERLKPGPVKQMELEEDLKRIRKETLEEGTQKGLKKGLRKGRREGKKEGLSLGLNQGLKQGKKEKAIEMAKLLKKKGVSIDIIAATSKLSKEEIEKL